MLGKRGTRVAVEELSFAVDAGEVLRVVGPNRAGKTTAIRLLTTILAPSHGSSTVAGAPSTRPAEMRPYRSPTGERRLPPTGKPARSSSTITRASTGIVR